MPWVRFDDQFSINRKVARLSDGAFRLHTVAIFWCARNLTDGTIPEEDLEDLAVRMRAPLRLVSELLNRGLWHQIGYACDSPDCPAHPDNEVPAGTTGWVVHDYLEYQPSKTRVKRDREAAAKRQRKWRDQQKTPQVDGTRNGVTDGVSHAAPSRPDPSIPKNAPPATPGPPTGGPRGGRLPDAFPVTEEMAAWARDKAPSCGTADHESFCDYWRGVPGAKGRKLDWVATWRNWMRREHERRAPASGRGGNVVPIDRRPAVGGTDQRLTEHAALIAQLAAQENDRR